MVQGAMRAELPRGLPWCLASYIDGRSWDLSSLVSVNDPLDSNHTDTIVFIAVLVGSIEGRGLWLARMRR